MDTSRTLEKIKVWLFLHKLDYYDSHAHDVPAKCKTLEFFRHDFCMRGGQELRKSEPNNHIP